MIWLCDSYRKGDIYVIPETEKGLFTVRLNDCTRDYADVNVIGNDGLNVFSCRREMNLLTEQIPVSVGNLAHGHYVLRIVYKNRFFEQFFNVN